MEVWQYEIYEYVGNVKFETGELFYLLDFDKYDRPMMKRVSDGFFYNVANIHEWEDDWAYLRTV